MSSWLFNSILNYQPESNLQLIIQQYSQLPAVQLVIQQYIELPTRAQCTSGYSAVYSITSQIRIHSLLFNSILNYQPDLFV